MAFNPTWYTKALEVAEKGITPRSLFALEGMVNVNPSDGDTEVPE